MSSITLDEAEVAHIVSQLGDLHTYATQAWMADQENDEAYHAMSGALDSINRLTALIGGAGK